MSHIIFFEKYIITECTIIFLVGKGEGERDNGTICEGVEAPVKIFRVLKRLRSSSTVIYKKTVTLHVWDGMGWDEMGWMNDPATCNSGRCIWSPDGVKAGPMTNYSSPITTQQVMPYSQADDSWITGGRTQ
jgi:hypothetical protein